MSSTVKLSGSPQAWQESAIWPDFFTIDERISDRIASWKAAGDGNKVAHLERA